MQEEKPSITPKTSYQSSAVSSEQPIVSPELNEQSMPNNADSPLRPTKKQLELLEFIRQFIVEHGYGPSYREIMVGCNYTSVATVAVHIQNLIKRGHLQKNGRSARSLEIVGETIVSKPKLQTNEIKPAEEKWLVDKIGYIFDQLSDQPSIAESDLKKLQTLVDCLNVLGLNGASLEYSKRLNEIKSRLSPE